MKTIPILKTQLRNYLLTLKNKIFILTTHQTSYEDSNMAIIKKSLLFTAHFVNGNLTSVRCNLTGKFVKRSIYFAIENHTITEHGSITDFNATSLFDVITSNNYINVLNVLFLALFSVLAVSLINLFL